MMMTSTHKTKLPTPIPTCILALSPLPFALGDVLLCATKLLFVVVVVVDPVVDLIVVSSVEGSVVSLIVASVVGAAVVVEVIVLVLIVVVNEVVVRSSITIIASKANL